VATKAARSCVGSQYDILPTLHYIFMGFSTDNDKPIPVSMSAPRKALPSSSVSPAPNRSEAAAPYHWPTSIQMQQPYIRITDHDVLSGRGVNIAQHAGNERFRALICSRHDVNYCHAYTTAEKRAIAEQIVCHIESLDPPGRFLRRAGRVNRTARGLEGPWEQLTRDEAVKKTCQALRDCNRQDRTGYAASVFVPEDVSLSEHERFKSGFTNKQLAEMAAAQAKFKSDPKDQKSAAAPQISASEVHKRDRQGEMFDVTYPPQAEIPSHHDDYEPTPIGKTASHPVHQPWMKKRRSIDIMQGEVTPMPHTTPATNSTSGGFSSFPDESESRISGHRHHHMLNVFSPVTTDAMTALLSCNIANMRAENTKTEHSMAAPPSAASMAQVEHEQDFVDCQDDFSAHFDEDDVISNLVHDDIHKHLADSSNDDPIGVPLDMSTDAAVSAAMRSSTRSSASQDDGESRRVLDFNLPSPLRLEHHHGDPF
jgi:hypothetical protein